MSANPARGCTIRVNGGNRDGAVPLANNQHDIQLRVFHCRVAKQLAMVDPITNQYVMRFSKL